MFELNGEILRVMDDRVGEDVSCGDDCAQKVKAAALHWGACTVGFAPVNEGDVYSFLGRRTDENANEIRLDHRSAVVYGVEMRYPAVSAAPSLSSSAESARAYLETAVIGAGLVRFIRRLGWSARTHINGNYLVVAPPLAARAGLGEIGRSGLLVTERWGPRVRLAVVTTDMPLPYDGPISFGLEEFCRLCGRCANGCPARAIDTGQSPGVSRDVRKWTVNAERCYRYWRTVGSDCGLCMKTCPFSRPDAQPFRAARQLIRRRPLVARGALRLYDFIFGRTPGARLKGVDSVDALTRK